MLVATMGGILLVEDCYNHETVELNCGVMVATMRGVYSRIATLGKLH